MGDRQNRTVSAVEVQDLTVAYREQPALWDVDLSVPPGVLLAIVGPNGAGKTTLLKAILGLLRPVAGQVLIFGQPVEQQRRRISYVPQRGSVDWDFPTSVLDVVMMGTYGELGWIRRPGRRERERALRSLGQFDELAKISAEQADSDLYSYSDHIADLGTDAMEREKMLLFASKEGRYLYRVEEALRRLYKDPANFGICQNCGKPISFERLDALPHARYCIECKLKEEADAA